MKGINLNGTIKTYSSVPKTWGNILGVNYMSDEELKGLGFYDIVYPEKNYRKNMVKFILMLTTKYSHTQLNQ